VAEQSPRCILRRPQVIDECRLCGVTKPLSFEHVPPRGAYNSFPRFRPDTKQFIAHKYQGGPAPAMIEEPRGAGAYTLCEGCNNRCSRYAREFIEWAVCWQTALDSTPAASSISASPITRRSRVMKEIVAMALSASPPKTGRINDGLRRYVWNTESKGLPAGIRVHAALTCDKDARQAAGGANVNMETGSASIFTEIAFAAFIFVMTLADSTAPDTRLLDISHLATAGYGDREPTPLTLSILRLHSHYQGTYL
jgi:hypothetical protein